MATSPFFDESLDLVRSTRGLGPTLDLACGRGRHALACARAGVPTVAIDRNAGHLRELAAATRGAHPPLPAPISCVRADVEAGCEIPVRSGSCGAILVFRFLFRPLAAAIAEALAPGGLLLYETFTVSQRELGYGPYRDAFLLGEGELPTLFPMLEVLDTSEGLTAEARPAHTARLLARRR